MSTAFRILLGLGFAAAALVVIMGPRWRGSFYRSWVRPRMVAFGIVVVLMTAVVYLYRVVNALRAHG